MFGLLLDLCCTKASEESFVCVRSYMLKQSLLCGVYVGLHGYQCHRGSPQIEVAPIGVGVVKASLS